MDSVLDVLRPQVDQIFNPKRQKEDSLLLVMTESGDKVVKDSLGRYLLKRNSTAKKTLYQRFNGGGFDTKGEY